MIFYYIEEHIYNKQNVNYVTKIIYLSDKFLYVGIQKSIQYVFQNKTWKYLEFDCCFLFSLKCGLNSLN